MAERGEGYVDVFISHKKEDLAIAQDLAARVKARGYEAYLDAADAELTEVQSTRALAERIRGRLRRAKCLIFVATPRAVDSKWMPWELGFFDGRWGQPTVGLYVQNLPRMKAQRDGADGRFTVQEYLELYELVDNESLPAFLERATSSAMLANRKDVDVDRFLTLLTSAGRNPFAFQLGWTQYLLGMLQPLAAAVPPWKAQLDAQIDLISRWRAAAESAAAPASGGADAFDPLGVWTHWLRETHVGGVAASAGPAVKRDAAPHALALQRTFDELMKAAMNAPK